MPNVGTWTPPFLDDLENKENCFRTIFILMMLPAEVLLFSCRCVALFNVLYITELFLITSKRVQRVLQRNVFSSALRDFQSRRLILLPLASIQFKFILSFQRQQDGSENTFCGSTQNLLNPPLSPLLWRGDWHKKIVAYSLNCSLVLLCC